MVGAPPVTDPGAPGSAANASASCVRVARQPVLAGDGSTHGYQLSFVGTSVLDVFLDLDPARATFEVMSASLLAVGLDALVGTRVPFLSVPAPLLLDGSVQLLPPDRVVVGVRSDSADSPLLDACRVLRRQGYRLALEDFRGEEALLPLVEYVTVDLAADPVEVQQRFVRVARSSADVIATGVDSLEQQRLARQLGADYVQGYAFARPELLAARELAPFKLAYVGLLRETSCSEMDFGRVETIVKQDLSLSYKLLRYVSSAGLGRRGSMESVRRPWCCWAPSRSTGGSRWRRSAAWSASAPKNWR